MQDIKVKPNKGFVMQLESYCVEIGVDETLAKKEKLNKNCFSADKREKNTNKTQNQNVEEEFLDFSVKKPNLQRRTSLTKG